MKSVLFILKIVMLTIFLTTISCSTDNLVVFPQEQYAEDIFVNEDGYPTSVSSKDVDDMCLSGFYVNWEWEGFNNGYYGDAVIFNGDFSYQKEAIIDIIPNR